MPSVRKQRKPLPDIKCSDTKCEDGLHAYRYHPRKPNGKEYEGVPCHSCGDNSIDWDSFRRRDLSDIDYTFQNLKREFIRHSFWKAPIDKVMREELFQDGLKKIAIEIKKRLIKSVKKKGKEQYRDSTQTPILKYNILYFAQHATATCCRKCIKIWHNIPYDKELDENDLNYLSKVMIMYIDIRVPGIPEEKPQLKIL